MRTQRTRPEDRDDSTVRPSTSQAVTPTPDLATASSLVHEPTADSVEVVRLEAGSVYTAVSATYSGLEIRRQVGGLDSFVIDYVARDPTRLAFILDGPMIVYQTGDAESDNSPPGAPGPIKLLTTRSERTLNFDDDLVSLHHAAIVDGRAMALVSRTPQNDSAEASTNLAIFDLNNDEQMDLIVGASDDDPIADARFSDGRIVVHRAPNTLNARVEILDRDSNPIAEIPLSRDYEWTITETSALGPHFVDDLPYLARIDFDPRDGETSELELLSLPAAGIEIGAGFCGRAEEHVGDLICAQEPPLPPVRIKLYNSIVDPEKGFDEGTVTYPRQSMSRTIEPLGPCGKQNPSTPEDVSYGQQFDHDGDGRFDFDAFLFEQNGNIGIQAVSAEGHYSEYLEVTQLPVETIGPIAFELSDDFDDRLLDIKLSHPDFGAAYIGFDGCNLNQIGWVAK